MSRTYPAIKSKYQKHPKVSYRAYLNNANEPREYLSQDVPAALEAELLDNSANARQEFRHLAHRMRNRYS